MTNSNIDQKWIFTFGFGHDHPDSYIKITGTYESARSTMQRFFGSRWAFQYPSEKEAGIAEFNLKEIHLRDFTMIPKRRKD